MTKRICDTGLLTAFVRRELDADAEQKLTAHLDDCESCGQFLEHEVAEAATWQEARKFLGNRAFQNRDAIHDHEDHRDAQIEQVLAQLAPTDDPDSLGRIGDYEVTGVIGSGGMGVVLKAHDRSLDRVVAVKVMAPQLATSGSARQRFAREAKAAAAVLHPNVIAIHGVSNDQSLPYLIMPYVRGASLQKRIDTEGPLATIDILRIGLQVAAGLAAAHEQGLVHRDIKPANILLEHGIERVAITDFGLARAVDDASMTRSGVIAGTPQYMSPEQARGEAIDTRSDLFSLGSLLYMMCTGHSPFRAETSYGVLYRITHDEPRAIRELNPNIPEWLEQIVMKLLSKSRENRFQSSQQIAEVLEECIAHAQRPTTTPLPKSVSQLSQLPPWKQSGGSRRIYLWQRFAIGLAVLATILSGILVVIESNKGTLTIECDAKNVPIRIMQGDETVDRLTVIRSGTTLRLKAGEYTVEIDEPNSDFVILNNKVTLSRSNNAIVTISFSSAIDLLASDTQTNSIPPEPIIPELPKITKTFQQLQGKWRLIRHITPEGIEDTVPPSCSLEFNAARITIREDGKPDASTLFQVDDDSQPTVKITLMDEGEVGISLGLLRIEGNKLEIVVSKKHLPPNQTSRPEKLQWESGAWYMELQRIKPNETIGPT